MSGFTLSPKALTLTTETIRGDIKTQHKWVSLSDSYRAEGVTSSMLETEKKGGNEDLRKQVKGAIVAAFTEAQQRLLASDTKTLKDDAQKGNKKTLQQSIGAYLDKIRTHIANAEKAEEGGDESSATKTPIQRIHADLDKAVAKLQKLENASFNIATAIERINAVKGMMPAL